MAPGLEEAKTSAQRGADSHLELVESKGNPLSWNRRESQPIAEEAWRCGSLVLNMMWTGCEHGGWIDPATSRWKMSFVLSDARAFATGAGAGDWCQRGSQAG